MNRLTFIQRMAMACGMAIAAPKLAKAAEAIPPKIKKQTLIEQEKLDKFFTPWAAGVTGQFHYSGVCYPTHTGVVPYDWTNF